MRFYCIEMRYNFNSEKLAFILENLGLTIIERGFCAAVAF